MIADDDVDACGLERGDWLHRARPAVAGHDDGCASRQRRANAGVGKIVSVNEPLGDERNDVASEELERSGHQRRRTHAVHVVVAVDQNCLAIANGPHETLDRALHVEHLFRRQKLIEPRTQVALRDVGGRVSARGQKATDRLGQKQLRAQRLHHGRIGCHGQNPTGARTGYRRCDGHALNLGDASHRFNGQRVVIPPHTGAHRNLHTSRASRTPPWPHAAGWESRCRRHCTTCREAERPTRCACALARDRTWTA